MSWLTCTRSSARRIDMRRRGLSSGKPIASAAPDLRVLSPTGPILCL
jgi:hypothetical protein